MPSKPKTVFERLTGKDVKLLDGSVAKITEISANGKTAKLNKGAKKLNLPVEEIEARGGRFYQKKTKIEEGSTMSEATPVESVETEVAAEIVVEVPAEVEEVDAVEVTTNAVEEFLAETTMLACQFCGHLYDAELEGLAKPDDIANMCQDCLEMSENGLLAKGIPGGDISVEMVIEWLCRYYGMVNSDLVIQIIGPEPTVEPAEAPPVEEEEEFVHDFQTSVEEFIFARREIAKTLIHVINLVSGNASLGDETPESIMLKLEPFDFELTSLCGGWIISQTEEGMVREEEFTALDELFSYFCGAQEDLGDDTELPDEEEDFEDDEDEVLEYLPLGTFYRLQNCKSEENNKKLVKILEAYKPETEDGSYTYRVEDKDGKKYKVTESKLKPSIKSF
jgi:hypothetical protein